MADIYELFSDQDVKAIICSIGGSSSNKLLDKINYDFIKKNKKIFMGYSDNTALLLSLLNKANIPTFHGPDVYEFSRISSDARKFFKKCFSGENKVIRYPKTMSVWREGKAKGKSFGGNLTLINSLLGSNYIKAKKGSILFWEEIGESPAMIDFKLNEMRLKGLFNQINGMIVGKLTDCQDKKYPKDDRPIKDILLEATQEYNFPIVKVDWFGHEVNDFYIMPLNHDASLDTYKKEFNIN